MSEHSAQVKTVKVSIPKLLAYKQVAAQFANQDPANIQTKLWFAVQRSEKAINEVLKPVFDLNTEEQEEVDDIQRNNQATDASGILLYSNTLDRQGNLQPMRQYTATGEKKRNLELKECRDKYTNLRNSMLFTEEGTDKEVELRLHISPEFPNGMDPAMVSIFKGVILDETSVEKLKLL